MIFVAVWHYGVAGAAWATVLCQLFSMILILFVLKRNRSGCAVSFSQIKITPHLLKKMIQIGIPAGMQSVFYTISNLIIQTDINSFGTVTVAAWAAYGRIDSFYWMTISAFGLALTTFSGQNFGANKIDRIRRSTRDGLYMGGAAAVCCTIFFYISGKMIFRLFTPDENVISSGMIILHFMAPFFIVYMPLEILSGVIRGTGDSLIPTVITCFGVCALRLLWLLAVVPFHQTVITVLWCYPFTWITTALMFMIYYKKGKWLTRHMIQQNQ